MNQDCSIEVIDNCTWHWCNSLGECPLILHLGRRSPLILLHFLVILYLAFIPRHVEHGFLRIHEIIVVY